VFCCLFSFWGLYDIALEDSFNKFGDSIECAFEFKVFWFEELDECGSGFIFSLFDSPEVDCFVVLLFKVVEVFLELVICDGVLCDCV